MDKNGKFKRFCDGVTKISWWIFWCGVVAILFVVAMLLIPIPLDMDNLSLEGYRTLLVEMYVKADEVDKPKAAHRQLTAWGLSAEKIVIPVCIGIGTAFVLFWGFMQLKEQRKALVEQNKIAQKEHAATLFKNAINHLGSERHAVVLGGVYALNDLVRTYNEADNINDQYNRTVFEILCSFIREETRKLKYVAKIEEEFSGTPIPCHLAEKKAVSLNVIQTIIDRLFLRSESPRLYPLGHPHFKPLLRKADLRLVEFAPVSDVRNVNWFNADLREADLRRAKLRKADLRKAVLRKAKLDGANLGEAQLQWADLKKAILVGTYLRKANLQGANLDQTDLQGANLGEAHLQGANLQVSLNNPSPRWFETADLRGIQNKSNLFELHEIYRHALESGTDLKTDLSGITLYDDRGTILDEEEKRAWFTKEEVNADISDLPVTELRELVKQFGLLKDNR